MPLIVAIEPDRRQASQLSAVVRGRLRAELVIAESAERALAALGDRVPDLILTSPLLSPKDDAALGERLRALDGAAAHVQTLTIPVLAAPRRARSSSNGRGMLSALRRERSKPAAPEGCDPDVFADQCKDYLERAETERLVHLAEQASVAPIAPLPSPAPPVEMSRTISESPAIEAPRAIEASPAIQAPRTFEAEPPIRPSAPVAKASPKRAARRLAQEAPPTLIAAVAALEALEAETPAAQVVTEEGRLEVDPLSSAQAAEGAQAVEEEVEADKNIEDTLELDLTSLFDEAGEPASTSAHPADEGEPAVYEIDAAVLNAEIEAVAISEEREPQQNAAAPQQSVEALPTEDEPEPEATAPSETELYMPLAWTAAHWPALDSHVPELRVSGLGEYPASRDAEESQEWLEMIEALRRDAQPVKIARSGSAQADPAGKKKRRRTGSAVQDEWGFFDPKQCGFAALLEKLEEITDQEDGPAPRQA